MSCRALSDKPRAIVLLWQMLTFLCSRHVGEWPKITVIWMLKSRTVMCRCNRRSMSEENECANCSRGGCLCQVPENCKHQVLLAPRCTCKLFVKISALHCVWLLGLQKKLHRHIAVFGSISPCMESNYNKAIDNSVCRQLRAGMRL